MFSNAVKSKAKITLLEFYFKLHKSFCGRRCESVYAAKKLCNKYEQKIMVLTRSVQEDITIVV